MSGPQDGTYGIPLKVLKLQRLCAGVWDKRPTRNRLQTEFGVSDVYAHLQAIKVHYIASLKLKTIGFI
ncbi:MAG: hypothetical protein LBF43_00940 [Puniceicoccales bacterium]|jgi:hypothetical protein|nr:hypothetical protein [Puniceicoccales bacterium]